MENSCTKVKGGARIGKIKFRPKEEPHKLLVRIGSWRESGRQGGCSGSTLGLLGVLSLSSYFHSA